MHHNVFWYLGGICLILSLIVQYIQSQVGDDDSAVRARLQQWYDTLQNSDWSRLVVLTTQSAERFFDYLFGKRILSSRFLLVGGTISLLGNVIIFGLLLGVRVNNLSWTIVPVVLGNVALDLISLLCARLYIRHVARVGQVAASRIVAVLTVISLAALVASVVLITATLVIVDAYAFYGNASRQTLSTIITFILRDPAQMFAVVPGALPAAFSAIVLFVVYLSIALAVSSRPWTREQLSSSIEKLSKIKSPVLSRVLWTITAISTVLGFLSH